MKNLTKLFFFTAIGVLFFTGDLDEATQFGFTIIQDAEAVVGRPLTPVSVGGVRRRTRRRTAAVTATAVTATAIATTPVVATPVVATPVVVTPVPVVVTPVPVAVGTIVSVLPAGCSTIISAGATYHSCGGVYYKPAFQSNNVVYMVVDQP
jgi:hypothetical protein